MRGNNNRIVKRANRYLILDSIRSSNQITHEELVRITRLSDPTVRNIVNDLVQEGIVKKDGLAESTGGRQAALLKFNESSFFAMGIDIAGNKVMLAVSDLKGNIVYLCCETIDTEAEKNEVLDFLVSLCEKAILEAKISKEKVIGLGIGIPGVIDVGKDISVFVERIKSWRKDVHVVSYLEEKLEIKVYIRNDAHLLGLVEKYLYTDESIKNFIYIAMRNGIGMAIFINGDLFEGDMGNAGYIGHMKIELEGYECVCGKKGCIETLVNSKYLVEEYIQLKKEKGLTADTTGAVESKYLDFFIERARSGDKEAEIILKKSGFVLGIGIANVIKILDFTHIIVGGLPKGKEDIFMPAIREAINQNTNNYLVEKVSIDYGKLTYDKAALGGCFLAIDNFFMEPKLTLSI